MHPKMFLKNSVADPNASKSTEHSFRCVCLSLYSHTIRIASNCMTFLTTCVVYGSLCHFMNYPGRLEPLFQSSRHQLLLHFFLSFAIPFCLLPICPTSCSRHAPSTVTRSRAAPLLPRPRNHVGLSCAYGIKNLKKRKLVTNRHIHITLDKTFLPQILITLSRITRGHHRQSYTPQRQKKDSHPHQNQVKNNNSHALHMALTRIIP